MTVIVVFKFVAIMFAATLGFGLLFTLLFLVWSIFNLDDGTP